MQKFGSEKLLKSVRQTILFVNCATWCWTVKHFDDLKRVISKLPDLATISVKKCGLNVEEVKSIIFAVEADLALHLNLSDNWPVAQLSLSLLRSRSWRFWYYKPGC